MKAEYIAVHEAACQALWLRIFFFPQTKLVDSIISRPLKIHCGNSAAVCFPWNNRRSTNSKHIDLKYYNIKERVKHRELAIVKIGTLHQLADPFTKLLTVAAFQTHIANIGILTTFDT